jgi:hypothetical protein
MTGLMEREPVPLHPIPKIRWHEEDVEATLKK